MIEQRPLVPELLGAQVALHLALVLLPKIKNVR